LLFCGGGTDQSGLNSEVNNNNNNNSTQFNGYLLKCKLNSTNDYYIASTKTQIKHKKNSTNKEKRGTKQTKQTQYGMKGNIKDYWGKSPKPLRKHKLVNKKCHKLTQYLSERSNGFPKDNDVFVHVVSSRNTSSERRVFVNGSKQGEVSKFKRQNPLTITSKSGRQHFKTE
jgi:hypothetical protein